ncbi:Flagellin N-methylase [compost metagenome]
MSDDSKAADKKQARNERKEAHLRGMYDRYREQFRAAGSEDAPSVARRVHIAIDEVLERDRNKSADSDGIQCRKGCDHCCRGPVEIWPQEAALLVEAARATGVEIDRARLERQGRYIMDTWRQQPAADKACVFLGADGGCQVYESRPSACRKLLVTSDPALCDADHHPLKSVTRWFSWEAEMMESAALETCGGVLMPQALLTVLNGSGKAPVDG